MRQQGANQFEKGLSLDTNAIAMDNHTLSSALNATMITMNGNELVLQNDMGNAKVESAYLPAGYVPVGMQEFGGIVYVASYNPFEKKSQIGCFPSPERNISGEELGQDGCKLLDLIESSNSNKLINTTSRALLIKGPIRPGDKFVITSSNADDIASKISNDLIDFKVLVLDADGSGIDITKDMNYFNSGPLGFIYNGTEPSNDKFTTYKQKIAGSIWLQESLIFPAYITVSITSTAIENSDNVRVEFTATAYDSDGLPWSIKHQKNIEEGKLDFVYTITGGTQIGNNAVEVEKGVGKTLEYSIMPQYSFGKIGVLEQTGKIDVDSLGSGHIDIPVVRYYNDVINNQFSLEYTINAYVENSNHSVSKVYLELYDYKDCVINENTKSITLPEAKKLFLSTSNIFGSYITLIPYADSSEGAMLLKGHMYIARLVAECSTKGVQSTTLYTSEWLTIITSAITNQFYMNTPAESVLSCKSAHELLLDWDINWEEKKQGESWEDSNPESLNTGTPLPTTMPTDSLITLHTIREGTIMMKYKAEIDVNTIDANFPFDIITKASISVPEAAEQVHTILKTTIETTGGKTNQSGIITSEEKPALFVDPSTSSIVNYANNVWSEVRNTGGTRDIEENENDGSIIRTLHYRLNSQLFANLANEGNSIEYTGSDVPALVPLQTLRSQDEDDIKAMIGSETFSTYDSSGNISSVEPQAWWVWGIAEGNKKAKERKMAVMQAPTEYTKSSEAVGSIPAQEALTEDGYGLFSTSSTNAVWKFYSTVTMDYLHNNLKVYPYLFFWQGCDDSACALYSSRSGSNGTKNYSIPIMIDASGEMFVIGQCTTGIDHAKLALKSVIDSLSKIYVYQQGQTVSFTYYKASDALTDYIYTNPYQAKIESKYKVTPTVKFVLDKNAETPVEYLGGRYTLDENNTTIYLPTFGIKEVSSKGSNEKVFTTYVNAPDQSIKNMEYLDAQPTLGNVAVIRDQSSTTPAVVSSAVKIVDGRESGTEPFDTSHPYFAYSGSGATTKLCDCTKPLPTGIPDNKAGKGIADAIRNRYLRVIYSPENERNILIVNRSAISSIIGNNSAKYIGANTEVRSNLAKIASKHLLNLNLFTDMNSMGVSNS